MEDGEGELLRSDSSRRSTAVESPVVVSAHDENEQSGFVAQRIDELREAGTALNEIAVLFRSSSHSFDLELNLGKQGIPSGSLAE
jgi:superfamily I DNA/RNA helicase